MRLRERLVQIDALFEGVLGVVVLLCVATGALDSSDFPSPVGTVVLLLVGWALLTLCAVVVTVTTSSPGATLNRCRTSSDSPSPKRPRRSLCAGVASE